MNDQELNRLLAKIQLLDNRQVDNGTFLAWREVVGDLHYEDANQAVIDHFRETPAYLMPAHIVTRAKAIRARHLERNFNILDEAGAASGAPRPKNYEAMSRAHANPVAFAQEVAIYHQQLRDEGMAELVPANARPF